MLHAKLMLFKFKYSLIYLQNYGHGAKYFYLPKNRTQGNLAKAKESSA